MPVVRKLKEVEEMNLLHYLHEFRQSTYTTLSSQIRIEFLRDIQIQMCREFLNAILKEFRFRFSKN